MPEQVLPVAVIQSDAAHAAPMKVLFSALLTCCVVAGLCCGVSCAQSVEARVERIRINSACRPASSETGAERLNTSCIPAFSFAETHLPAQASFSAERAPSLVRLRTSLSLFVASGCRQACRLPQVVLACRWSPLRVKDPAMPTLKSNLLACPVPPL